MKCVSQTFACWVFLPRSLSSIDWFHMRSFVFARTVFPLLFFFPLFSSPSASSSNTSTTRRAIPPPPGARPRARRARAHCRARGRPDDRHRSECTGIIHAPKPTNTSASLMTNQSVFIKKPNLRLSIGYLLHMLARNVSKRVQKYFVLPSL